MDVTADRTLKRDVEAIDALFAPLADVRMMLAVSGGTDSIALMVLADKWARQRGDQPRPIVLTVDHGLRHGSEADAAFVVATAQKLGLEHRVLTWTEPKPATGIQAAARTARYALLTEAVASQAQLNAVPSVLVTAHTRNDQAETVVMRLARGSGLTGLAAMRRLSKRIDIPADAPLRQTLIARPLLGVTKDELHAAREAAGIGFRHDPSNDDVAYERVRLRMAAHALAATGLDDAALATAADQLGSADDAVTTATAAACCSLYANPSGVLARIDLRGFVDLPREVAQRVLRYAITDIARPAKPFNRDRLRALCQGLQTLFQTAACAAAVPFAATMAGAVVRVSADRLHIEVAREWGRMGLPSLMVDVGQRLVWDRRFLVHNTSAKPVTIAPLDNAGRMALRSVVPDAAVAAGWTAEVARTLPAIWDEGRLVSAPLLGVRADGGSAAATGIEMTFMPWPVPTVLPDRARRFFQMGPEASPR